MSVAPPKKPVVELMTRFAIAAQLFHSRSEKRLVAHDLTLAQLSVLSHLARRSEPCRVTDIARAVDVGQPAVTKILSKFSSAGWVKMVASTSDKRSKSAVIQPEGAQHLGQVQRQLMPEIGNFFADWAEEDISQFTDHLTRFGRFLDENRLLDDTS